MVNFPNGEPGSTAPVPGVRPPGRGGSVINNGVGDKGSGLLLLLLDRNPLLSGCQHLIEGVHAHSCPAEGEGPQGEGHGILGPRSPPALRSLEPRLTGWT